MATHKLVDRVHHQTVHLVFANGSDGEAKLICPFPVHEIKVTAFPTGQTADTSDGISRELYSDLVGNTLAVLPVVDTEAVAVPSLPTWTFTYEQGKPVSGDYRFNIRLDGTASPISGEVLLHFEFVGKPFKVLVL